MKILWKMVNETAPYGFIRIECVFGECYWNEKKQDLEMSFWTFNFFFFFFIDYIQTMEKKQSGMQNQER